MDGDRERGEEDQPLDEAEDSISDKIACVHYTTCYWSVAALYLLVFVLMVISTLHQYWSRLGPDDDPRLYGLFRLNEGSAANKHTTWNCVKKVACVEDSEGSTCKTGTDLHSAGSTFFALELFAFLCALLLVERFVYLALRRGVAWGWTIYLLATLTFAVQITATVAWFGISGAEFDVNCHEPPADPTDPWDVCADDGPKIAICVTILTALVGIYACVAFKSKPLFTNEVDEVGSVRLVCMPATWVMALLLIPMLANISLMIVSLIETEWTETNDVTGSLWYYTSYLDYSNYGYECIAYPNCFVSPDSGLCKTFRDLSDAGLTYMSLEIASLILFAWWLMPTIHLVGGVEYGYPFLNYLSGALCFFVHFVATIAWFGVSQADFDLSCDAKEFDPRTKWSICAGVGPQLAVANCAVFCVSYPLWALVYYNRKGQVQAPKQEVELGSSPRLED